MLTTRVKYLSSCLLSLLFVNTAEAQFLRGLQDRLVDAIESRVEKNVEDRVMEGVEQSAGQAIDQTFASVFGGAGATQNADGSTTPSILSRMLDTSNITTEEEYRFDIATTFEMQSFDSQGTPSEAMEMVFHYSEDAPYTGTRIVSGEGANTGAAMIIYDFNNSIMLMLMEAEESRFSMAYNWDIAAAEWDTAWELPEDEASAAPGEVPRFERIGSRSINGYNCEGYRTTDEEQITEIWVTDEIASGMERIFQANRTVPMLNNNLPEGFPQGMLMEMNSENRQSGEKFQMRTKDIDTNSQVSFLMSDYPLLSLGLPPMGQ